MKLAQNKVAMGVLGWAVLVYILGWLTGHFYWLSIALLPVAIYEAVRTEGTKNTKPLSAITCLLLVAQFLHTSKIYPWPLDVSGLVSLLPIKLPVGIDEALFMSVLILLVLALLLVKYTWGSVTKFLAIVLLVGALGQAYLFLPEIKGLLKSPAGQRLWNEQKVRIQDNIYYRLRNELY